MVFVTKTLGKKSAFFFKKQQEQLGSVNGYIEEFIEGQRVVKVFCREEKSKEKFAFHNENFRKSATNAHTCASIIMPIMGNLSYFNFAATATLGAFIIIPQILFYIGRPDQFPH